MDFFPAEITKRHIVCIGEFVPLDSARIVHNGYAMVSDP